MHKNFARHADTLSTCSHLPHTRVGSVRDTLHTLTSAPYLCRHRMGYSAQTAEHQRCHTTGRDRGTELNQIDIPAYLCTRTILHSQVMRLHIAASGRSHICNSIFCTFSQNNHHTSPRHKSFVLLLTSSPYLCVQRQLGSRSECPLCKNSRISRM